MKQDSGVTQALSQFGFEGENLRVVLGSDMSWFNANDVCKTLGYVNTAQTLGVNPSPFTGGRPFPSSSARFGRFHRGMI